MFILLGLVPIIGLAIFPPLLELQFFGLWGIGFWVLFSWLIIWIYKSTARASNVRDEEVLGTYITKAFYYEPWEEEVLVTETETHTDEDGNTHEVEVSHWETVYHPEEFEIQLPRRDGEASDMLLLTEGRESVSDSVYQRCVTAFGNEHYTEIDREDTEESHILENGGCYYTVWPETRGALLYWYLTNEYENRTLRNSNVYKTVDLPQETVETYQLEEYGEDSIYGNLPHTSTALLEEETEYFNCFLREDNIKLNFICLKDAPISQADLWRQYWKNGKRNTINVVLGVKRKKIEWCQAFGWQNETLHVELRSFIMEHAKEGLNGLAARFNEIKQLIDRTYTPADFSKYDFIPVQYSGFGITTLALCVAAMIFGAVYILAPDIDRGRLAREARTQEKNTLAAHLLDEHLRRYPYDTVKRNEQAIWSGWDDKWADAGLIWDRLLTDKKLDDPGIKACLLMNKGMAESKLGKHKSSVSYLRNAIELYPLKYEYYCLLRHEYNQLKYTNSIKRLDREFKTQFKKNAAQECKQLYEKNKLLLTCSWSDTGVSMHSRFYRWWQKL